jgi:DNA-binding XRE family transcriptional regulator
MVTRRIKRSGQPRVQRSVNVRTQADELLSKVETLLSETRRVSRQVQQLVEAVSGADAGFPALPPADADGCRPAKETIRAVLARQLIEGRKRAGLTQAELAQRAGVRLETISRLESGKHAPNVRTVDKIDAALKAAGG